MRLQWWDIGSPYYTLMNRLDIKLQWVWKQKRKMFKLMHEIEFERFRVQIIKNGASDKKCQHAQTKAILLDS